MSPPAATRPEIPTTREGYNMCVSRGLVKKKIPTQQTEGTCLHNQYDLIISPPAREIQFEQENDTMIDLTLTLFSQQGQYCT